MMVIKILIKIRLKCGPDITPEWVLGPMYCSTVLYCTVLVYYQPYA